MIGSLASVAFKPWRSLDTWRALCHVSLDFVVGAAMFAVTFPLAIVSVSLVVVFPAAVLVSWLLFLAAHGLARVERTRFAALLDLELIDPQPELRGDSVWKRYKERISSASRWKELGYLLARYPLGAITTWVTIGTWAASVALIVMPALIPALPHRALDIGTVEVGPGLGAWLLALAGVMLFAFVAPWVTLGMADLDRAVGRGLLGRSERKAFEERVSDLESSRSRAVDSAESERRRIERDLHDGAQQRLIAVAMSLGIARQRLDDDPASARQLVGEAHDEVKSALKELRDLVRGIHPVILEDRGLDAALSAVVARCPVPVDLRVDVKERPVAAVESAAYFIVSEALVNVMRHSQATAATVEIARQGDRLTIAVADNGVGGADTTQGTGLQGLADRVSALDGWMQIVSPVGGPTTLMVEVPCAS